MKFAAKHYAAVDVLYKFHSLCNCYPLFGQKFFSAAISLVSAAIGHGVNSLV